MRDRFDGFLLRNQGHVDGCGWMWSHRYISSGPGSARSAADSDDLVINVQHVLGLGGAVIAGLFLRLVHDGLQILLGFLQVGQLALQVHILGGHILPERFSLCTPHHPCL